MLSKISVTRTPHSLPASSTARNEETKSTTRRRGDAEDVWLENEEFSAPPRSSLALSTCLVGPRGAEPGGAEAGLLVGGAGIGGQHHRIAGGRGKLDGDVEQLVHPEDGEPDLLARSNAAQPLLQIGAEAVQRDDLVCRSDAGLLRGRTLHHRLHLERAAPLCGGSLALCSAPPLSSGPDAGRTTGRRPTPPSAASTSSSSALRRARSNHPSRPGTRSSAAFSTPSSGRPGGRP